MSILADQFREKVNKMKDYNMKVESESNVGYPSGFLSFDFKNGAIIHGKNTKGGNSPYYSIGITDGSMVMIIGRSGSGKTTWAIQSAANIVRKYNTSCIYHDDIESGVSKGRMKQLTKFNPQELKDKYIHRNTGITAENFYERIKLIHDIKQGNRSDYEYDTGLFDDLGNRIYKLEPTVYMLDSLALLMPEKYTTEEEMSGQMSATAAAKMNSMLFKRVIPMLKSANIILMIINHINQNVSINPMMKSKAQVSYLKQSETLPGGNAAIYLSNLMLKFEDHSKLKDDSPFGFSGTMVDLILIKSRNNRANQSATLVFNQKEGYDPELSLLVMLKDAKEVNGAGAYLYIGEHSDKKFSQKKFKEKLREDPEFYKIFMEASMKVLKGFLGGSLEEIKEDEDKFDIAKDMLSNISY